jgi:hypothetical protein
MLLKTSDGLYEWAVNFPTRVVTHQNYFSPGQNRYSIIPKSRSDNGWCARLWWASIYHGSIPKVYTP